MAKNLEYHQASAAREDAQRLEGEATTVEPYPEGTVVSRSSQASRMFQPPALRGTGRPRFKLPPSASAPR